MQRDACANVSSSGADIYGCKRPVSKSTVAVFAARSASSVYDRFTSGATDSNKVGVCLHINDNGMNINSLSALPSGSFTLEIQVKPISKAASCVLPQCSDVVDREPRERTGDPPWRSQLNLHWDNEMSVLHVYVVVSYTNTLVHVVGLSSDALTPGGTLIPGQMAPQAKRLTSTGIPFNGRDACVEATAQPHGCVAELLSLTNSARSIASVVYNTVNIVKRDVHIF